MSGFGSGGDALQIAASLATVALAPLITVLLHALGLKLLASKPHAGVVLVMALIAATSAALVYLSSLVDLFYGRPYLELTDEAIASPTWRTVTRVRVVHGLLAVSGIPIVAQKMLHIAASSAHYGKDEGHPGT